MLTHRQFGVYEKALRTAAYLDPDWQKGLPTCGETAHAREPLSRVIAMLDSF